MSAPERLWSLGSDAARAVRRFRPAGPIGYRARSVPNAPLRNTRAEAEADEQHWLTGPPRCECGLTDPEMPCLDCRFSPAASELETCPSACVGRSHPGREHNPTEDGCYCWEFCAMGPTCPGANAGLDGGCWRVIPTATTGQNAAADESVRPDRGDA